METCLFNRKFFPNQSVIIITCCLLTVTSLFSQTKFDYKSMPCWRIETPSTIDSILTGLMLPKESPKAIEIVDINGNGIDNLDLLIASPEVSGDGPVSSKGYFQVYVLGDLVVPESVRRIIQNIALGSKAEQKITVSNLEQVMQYWSRMKTAKASIAVTTMTGLLQNYDETDYTFIVQRKPSGDFVFRMIGFDEEKTTPKNPWDPDSTSSIPNQSEVLRAFFQKMEEKIKAEVMVIYKTRVDTVFITKRD